ncbi:cold shock domain-containing protein [Sphaerisporangium sp. B11E5]|uniref:cold-shock protein n=1 Tax=Sphaerisporangium sp. B11E5 TaxID=3153563 RepID=UPI00325C7F54
MVTGRVISFDEFRGYGFIAPDTGGEDVFMHVNDLNGDKRLITVDSRVEFMLENGGKGPKASRVRLLERPGGGSVPQVPPVSPVPAMPREADRPAGDPGFCDVLSVRELSQEVTEAILAAVPSMTADQILRVRTVVVELAHGHGWTEG